MADVALFRRLHHLDNLGMNGGFTPGELHHLGIALRFHQVIEYALHFFECQVEARASIGKAERTLHVTGAIDFNNPHPGVLLILSTEAAVVRTSLLDVGGVGQRDGAGLVEARGGSIGLSITIDQSFKQTMLWTPLAHIHLIVTQENMRIDDPTALRANAPC